ncbi:hypothetical protein THH46_17315 [Pseudomonas sp. NA13]
MSVGIGRRGFDLGRGFYFLWCGESLALVGTALMEFALGVWVYNHTGSAVAFANVVLAATLPAVLFLPLAGGLADRISHRVIIVCCDVTLAVLLLGSWRCSGSNAWNRCTCTFSIAWRRLSAPFASRPIRRLSVRLSRPTSSPAPRD